MYFWIYLLQKLILLIVHPHSAHKSHQLLPDIPFLVTLYLEPTSPLLAWVLYVVTMRLWKKLGTYFPILPHPQVGPQIDLRARGELDASLEKQFASFIKCRCSILNDFLAMKFVVHECPSSVTKFRFINVWKIFDSLIRKHFPG